MSASVQVERPPLEAPLTLSEPAPSTLGLRDTFGLCADLGLPVSARHDGLGISATHGLSASIVSLTVASLLTVAVALPGALRARRAAAAS